MLAPEVSRRRRVCMPTLSVSDRSLLLLAYISQTCPDLKGWQSLVCSRPRLDNNRHHRDNIRRTALLASSSCPPDYWNMRRPKPLFAHTSHPPCHGFILASFSPNITRWLCLEEGCTPLPDPIAESCNSRSQRRRICTHLYVLTWVL